MTRSVFVMLIALAAPAYAEDGGTADGGTQTVGSEPLDTVTEGTPLDTTTFEVTPVGPDTNPDGGTISESPLGSGGTPVGSTPVQVVPTSLRIHRLAAPAVGASPGPGASPASNAGAGCSQAPGGGPDGALLLVAIAALATWTRYRSVRFARPRR